MSLLKDYRGPWDQQRRESGRAYAAFRAYLELGRAERSIDRAWKNTHAERSIDRAWRNKKANDQPVTDAEQNTRKTTAERASKHWFEWSRRFDWPSRAAAWDEHRTRLANAQFDRDMRLLAKQRAIYATVDFERAVARIRKAELILDKVDSLPVTDTEEETISADGTRKRVRIRGINLAGYASLMKEIRESANRAILGPSDSVPAAPPPGPLVVRRIEWQRPAESDE